MLVEAHVKVCVGIENHSAERYGSDFSRKEARSGIGDFNGCLEPNLRSCFDMVIDDLCVPLIAGPYAP